MTKEELVKEFRQLPTEEREALLREILSGVREEGTGNGFSVKSAGQQHTIEEKMAAVNRLRGAFKTDVAPPTDEELKKDYINYLTKKYS